MTSTGVIYREHDRTAQVAVAMLAVVAIAVIVDLVTGFALRGWSIIAGIFVLIAAVALGGVARYNAIRLTTDRLDVGRTSLSPDDLDRGFGVRTVDSLDEDQRVLVESPLPNRKDAPVQILGGAYGRSVGSSMLIVRRPGSDTNLAILTSRPDELGTALRAWLGAPSGTGS